MSARDDPGPPAGAPGPARPAADLTRGPLLRGLARLSGPMMVTALLQNAQSLIDLFWVGRLGPEAMASVAMGGTVMMLLFPALMGIATGALALVARAVGGGREDEARVAAAQALLLAVALAAATAVGGAFLARPLLRLLQAAPAVERGGAVYLRILLAGSFGMNLLFMANYALQGAGDTVRPMLFMATANLLNLVLDPLLIFGVGPLPRMGVAGAAVATALSEWIAAAVALRFLLGGRARLHLRGATWRPDRGTMARILRIGLPGSGQMLSRSLMGLAFMHLVAGFGTPAVAAYGTGLRLLMVLLMPAFALGGGAATMVGQNLGAGQPERARRAAWLAAGLDVAFMAVAAAALVAFAGPLIGLFNRDPAVVAEGTRYLRIVAPSFVFAALAIVLGRALGGAGDTFWPMVFTVASLWGLQVPLAWLWARVLWRTIDGVWWAMVAATLVHGLLVAAWFETGRWQRQRV